MWVYFMGKLVVFGPNVRRNGKFYRDDLVEIRQKIGQYFYEILPIL